MSTGLWQLDVLFATGLIKARMLFLKLLKLSQCYVLRSNVLHSVNDAWFIHFSCYNLGCLVLLSQWVYKTCDFFILFWRKRHFLSAIWLSYSQFSVTVKQTTSLIQCLPLDSDSNFDLKVRLQQFFNKSVIFSGMWGGVGNKVCYHFLKQSGFLNTTTKCSDNNRFIALYKSVLSCKNLIAHGCFDEK